MNQVKELWEVGQFKHSLPSFMTNPSIHPFIHSISMVSRTNKGNTPLQFSIWLAEYKNWLFRSNRQDRSALSI